MERLTLKGKLDLVETDIMLGFPIKDIRGWHPDVVIRDDDYTFKLMVKGDLRFEEASRVISKKARLSKAGGRALVVGKSLGK